MDRLLLISPVDPTGPAGGRAGLQRLNLHVLRALYGDRLSVFAPPGHGRPSVMAALAGHINGIDRASIAAIVSRIERDRIDTVFLDGSNFGAVAVAVRKRLPAVRIVTFFHNVETRFFWGAFRARPRIHAAGVLIANARAERAAVAASDIVLCLSERDSQDLKLFHGRAADAIVPMAMIDRYHTDTSPPDRPTYLLFVGGDFHANRAGIRWFAAQVAPHVAIETVVIGRGMDAVAGLDALTVIGAVDDLAPWYRGARAVIAPIFDGSGMKTKVAEALMHGKHIIGTSEAWSGYDPAVVAMNWCQTDARGFIAAIEQAEGLPAFDRAMRAIYDRHHSLPAARARLAAILGVPDHPATSA